MAVQAPGASPAATLPAIHDVAPHLAPRILSKPAETLNKDWSYRDRPFLGERLEHLRSVALAESPVHADGLLRHCTADEKEALMTYMRGETEIHHPPNFIKATMPVMQRAIVEQFHKLHIETTLTATIPCMQLDAR
ncbi:hypothetical protein JG687_00012654 [Phytophthora cactorum]|uniref:Uncharacterized protein n=1 Tax=Phytophthora cactorum TaxID=29920 RepID=A0A329SCG3_9STRA|nr:hypothetical protein Pcac1_g10005 [Phytophthora cactorum]KAG2822289.1 hypothetical protein PC112_g11011 [Phytophthora cactorum]KAG2824824.1 hypothetical protein PC111_g9654 [Phytophthora cactorum]KAG2904086.1 hypothetical protein PC114_g11992 [Phytophthora cactorum]KAG2919089.1 hypothetical protein PC115_g10268 [Phytophthora cactorum]